MMSQTESDLLQSTAWIPTEFDRYLFHEGTLYESYKMLGAHVMTVNGESGVRFAVWAPHAERVAVVGDFNHWDGSGHRLTQIPQSDIWYGFIPGIEEGSLYKYELVSNHQIFLKSDPYSFYSEVRPKTASIVHRLGQYKWHDQAWLNERRKTDIYHRPLLIYEVHLGSWKKKADGTLLSYREFAEELVDYVADRGYTHIELMPVMEHPYDRSWGYQITGYYSLTSRFGSPEDFMYFVDTCHQRGIGVILDWVPVHFCKDAHGLSRFDGTPLFEPQDTERAERHNWGTYNFDFSKPEVWSFLISNLLFWMEQYHVDGFRIDAVSHMIYLNHDRSSDRPLRNIEGGETNLEAIAFVKRMNEVLFSRYPGVLMIAEEATDWPLVTGQTDKGGLGFNYKWNMGWVHDVLRYMAMEPIERQNHYHLLTFSLLYTYSENFILPFSHDELVHGKRSLLNKMAGSYEEKFANLRLLHGFFMMHPGKKLTFMGNELGQFDEWKDLEQVDWELLENFDSHRTFNCFERELVQFYKKWPCFWRLDHEFEGFQWIEANANQDCIIAFIRQGKRKGDAAIIVCNFSRNHYDDYRLGVPSSGNYLEMFNTDCARYGGNTNEEGQMVSSEELPYQGQPCSVMLSLPPLSMLVFMKETKKRLRRS
ncbi:1,4-alpha-glucan branching protein GlgB [Pullulanibacillus sp. KACC 23026]|uniref:1,4-alpha-glucan branching protein GlgB n=1 Tax=Pullulanibacillus sp. KACC 23026 TaxID=3028315 RepID=UPI0023B04F28|nr:1,4-alpha-glucan branching protein GlgB [Pullulanibacillus sp. KACC 23026]WEG13830.1 1,4-alpha-glucan branching protein GlgB [Pullulanibacillus sp. KACC 23026]